MDARSTLCPENPRRPLWLTEFACCEASSVERLPAEGQMAYMREAIPLLERDESIEMYAWFLGLGVTVINGFLRFARLRHGP